MKKPALLLALLTAGSLCAAAQTVAVPESVLAELSRCDARFFEHLATQAGPLAAVPSFHREGRVAYFKVADRSDADKSQLRLAPVVKIGRFEAVSYVDEYVSLGPDEAMVAWGFVLRAPLQDILKASAELVWDSDRLLPDGDVHLRTEIWDHAQAEAGWQKISVPGGADAQTGTVERVLQIEPHEQDGALARFACKLRGAITPRLLQAIRPDLGTPLPSSK